MKLKIVDLEKFSKTNGISDLYGERHDNPGFEYEIHAVATARKQKYFLIFIPNFLFWCKDNKSIKLIANDPKTDWIYSKIYNYESKNDMQLKMSDLYCYEWMLEDRTFFYDIYENNTKASYEFRTKMKI